ncbi:M14 family zinc carboxypeptidase [Litorihabitans aurantiacus]|uniref:Zinc carboxypeptidase n=1 Tax=Litorihabitans aurantiacus TaxID=1930061 RepID=A0AA37UVH8_9MICO|nr:M14 family zinc carboxypeptidase [Litorihabitans aurantiacus]GMA31077.1 hypothetical protein GCM10025875_10690 [Litorihabitans aurantiacus]
MNRRILGAGLTLASITALALAPTAIATAAPVPISGTVTTAALPDDDGLPYPRQTPLPPQPFDPADRSIARGAIPFHEIAPRVNGWLGSEYVSAEIVGESTQGRPFYLVTITAPETAEQSAQQDAWRDAIKHDSAAAATDAALAAGYKKPIWFNNNIHGNEWDGTDAAISYVEDLLDRLDAGDPEALELVEGSRLYVTLSNNPDGRVNGTRATALGLDPNRDFITNTTPETAVVRDLTADIQPLFFIDMHGYTNYLQVEPTGPPQGENYDHDLLMPHAYAAALQIEQDYLAEFSGSGFPLYNGGIRIPYRDTPSGWDGFPPIFTAQYVQFQGAISYTVELGPGRTNPANPTEDARRLEHNREVGHQVLDSTLDYIQANEAELIENQIEIFRRGAAGEPLREIPANPDPANYPGPDQWAALWDEADVTGTEFPRAYLIPAGERQSSRTDAARLVEQLLAHGVEVQRTQAATTVDGVDYPAGTYLVDMHQPLRGLANVLLADGSDITDKVPTMYDISAWSLGRLWGATVDRIGDTGDPALAVATTPVDGVELTSQVADSAYLALRLEGVAEVRVLNALLNAGVPISSVGDGTYVIDPSGRTAAVALASEFGVDLAATDGDLPDGAAGVSALRVGYTGSNGSGDTFLALSQMGFVDPVFVNNTFTDYDAIDVLYLGSNLAFNTSEAQVAGRTALEAYLARGGGLVGASGPVTTVGTTFGVFDATRVTGRSDANGIVEVDTTTDGLLSGTSEPAAFFSSPSYFTGLGENVRVEQTWGTYLAGHWRSATNAATPVPVPGPVEFAGQPSVISAVGESGSRAVAFATSPLYRTHPTGAYPDVATALLWAGPEGEGVSPPTGVSFVDVTPSTQFYEEISWLAQNRISTGWELEDGTREFRPVTPVARDAMAAFLYRLAGSPDFEDPTTSPFTDVSTDNQFFTEIAWLAESGISTGWVQADGSAQFRPLEPIARDAMAAFLYRFGDLQGKVDGAPAPATSPFADVSTDNQFYAEIAWLAENGIATGWDGAGNDGTRVFRPLSPVNRDAMAAFMFRLHHLGQDV